MLQRYEKICTFANLSEENLQYSAFFSSIVPTMLILAQWTDTHTAPLRRWWTRWLKSLAWLCQFMGSTSVIRCPLTGPAPIWKKVIRQFHLANLVAPADAIPAKIIHESAISCHFLKKMHYLRNFLFGWNLCLTFLVWRRGIGEKNWQVTKQKNAQKTRKNYSKILIPDK